MSDSWAFPRQMCWPLGSCNRRGASAICQTPAPSWQKRQISSGQTGRQVGWNPNVLTHRKSGSCPFFPLSFFQKSCIRPTMIFPFDFGYLLPQLWSYQQQNTLKSAPIIIIGKTQKDKRHYKCPLLKPRCSSLYCKGAVRSLVGGGPIKRHNYLCRGPWPPLGLPGLPPPGCSAHRGEGGEAAGWPPALKFSPPPAPEETTTDLWQLFSSKKISKWELLYYMLNVQCSPPIDIQWTLQRIQNE